MVMPFGDTQSWTLVDQDAAVVEPVEVVQHLLGHASIATTTDAYAHLKVEDTRRALVAAGWLADRDGP